VSRAINIKLSSLKETRKLTSRAL